MRIFIPIEILILAPIVLLFAIPFIWFLKEARKNSLVVKNHIKRIADYLDKQKTKANCNTCAYRDHSDYGRCTICGVSIAAGGNGSWTSIKEREEMACKKSNSEHRDIIIELGQYKNIVLCRVLQMPTKAQREVVRTFTNGECDPPFEIDLRNNELLLDWDSLILGDELQNISVSLDCESEQEAAAWITRCQETLRKLNSYNRQKTHDSSSQSDTSGMTRVGEPGDAVIIDIGCYSNVIYGSTVSIDRSYFSDCIAHYVLQTSNNIKTTILLDKTDPIRSSLHPVLRYFVIAHHPGENGFCCTDCEASPEDTREACSQFIAAVRELNAKLRKDRDNAVVQSKPSQITMKVVS